MKAAQRGHWSAGALWSPGRCLRLVVVICCAASCRAASDLRPPCGQDAEPSYSEVGQPPAVRSWPAREAGSDWKPPACTGWTDTGFSSLIATAARFRASGGADGLLRHLGSVSHLTGIRYWSTTHGAWRTLITSAHALQDQNPDHRRQDFLPEELTPGSVHYFEQVDNLSGAAVYRLQVLELSSGRLVFAIENVTSIRRLLVTIFPPGAMQTVYFLDRESDGVWRYYSLLRTERNANWLAAGHPSSSINRANAFYRWLAGIPTDQEPPAAR